MSAPSSAFNSGMGMADSPVTSPYAATPVLSHMQLYRQPFAGGGGTPGGMALAAAGPPQPMPSLADRCFESYYHHFYAAHPCVLPKEFFVRLLKDGSTNLDHLVAAMRYLGSLFLDAGPARAMYLDEAIRLAYLPTTPKDGFLVQMFIILIVGLDGSCQQDRARQLLGDCERIAMEIGLNTREFAAANGRGNPVLEESWRRTWWDLYVVDGMVAGVHQVTNFLLFDVNAFVGLPCEEHEYMSGVRFPWTLAELSSPQIPFACFSFRLLFPVRYMERRDANLALGRQNIPSPMYMEDFDDQIFSGEERQFSSFAYRIAAIRIIGRLMRTPPIVFPQDENLEKIESLLSNWRMHLPASKRDDLTKNCQLDEMMFQAHFITHA